MSTPHKLSDLITVLNSLNKDGMKLFIILDVSSDTLIYDMQQIYKQYTCAIIT